MKKKLIGQIIFILILFCVMISISDNSSNLQPTDKINEIKNKILSLESSFKGFEQEDEYIRKVNQYVSELEEYDEIYNSDKYELLLHHKNLEKSLGNIEEYYEFYGINIVGTYSNKGNDLIIIIKDDAEFEKTNSKFSYADVAKHIGEHLKANIIKYKSNITPEELLIMFIGEKDEGYYLNKFFALRMSKIIDTQYQFYMRMVHAKDYFKFENNVSAFENNYLSDLIEINEYIY